MSARPTINTARLTPHDRTSFRINRAETWVRNTVRDAADPRVIPFPVGKVGLAVIERFAETPEQRRVRLHRLRSHRAIVLKMEPRRRSFEGRPTQETAA
jgi:hypothetical protein